VKGKVALDRIDGEMKKWLEILGEIGRIVALVRAGGRVSVM
jgi:hypothetical protein